EEFGLKSEEYYILIARLEPENNIVMAIEGYLHSKENGRRPLIVVGKTNTPHGKELVEKYGNERNVEFVGGIYDFKKLDSVRHFSMAYFHDHSVRSEEHTSELQSRFDLVCRLLLENKKTV